MRAWIASISVALCACPEDPEPPSTREWRVLAENFPGAMLRIWGTSARDVYAVGADADGDGPLVYRFDGESWRKLNPGTAGDLWWVQGVGPDDVRMVGEGGQVLRYTPSTDRFEVKQTPDGTTLFGVWGASSQDVWYVGGRVGPGEGVIWRDDGATISKVDAVATSSATFFKAQGWGSNQVWMVGQRGQVLFWDGQTLQERPIPVTLPLISVHGTSAQDVWVVGGVSGGVIYHWSSNGWVDETPDGCPQMNGVWAYGDKVIAMGFNGRGYARENGVWEDLGELPTFEDIHSVWVDEEGGIWAAGGRLASDPPGAGVVLYYGPPKASVPR